MQMVSPRQRNQAKVSWFNRKSKHQHRWTILSQTYETYVYKEMTLSGGMVETQRTPRTVYALRCSECGDVAQRTVNGSQPEPK